MNIRCRVDLSEAEQAELKSLLGGGKHPAQTGTNSAGGT